MAVYIPISKVSEDDVRVVYEYSKDVYGPDESRPGRRKIVRTLIAMCAIDKANGYVTHVDDNGWATGSRCFLHVRRKLTVHWKAGEFPDRTCWAS